MEVTGRIRLIGQTQDISSSFRKREVVVTTSEQYPQHIMIEFTQDRVGLLDSYQVGQEVRVSINLRGREWQSPQGETRYFNTIQGWRIEPFAQGQEAPQFQQQQSYGGQQGGFNQNQQQGSQFGQTNQFAQPNQQGGFNQAQQQGGFNQNQQQGGGMPQQNFQQGGQQQYNQFAQNNNSGNQFPPASSYNEEEHDDLPF